MNINKYINFSEIWNKEISTNLENVDEKAQGVIKQFNLDKEIDIDISECELNDNKLYFAFLQSGGQNESDNQGWFRRYDIIVDKDFYIIEAYYEQG